MENLPTIPLPGNPTSQLHTLNTIQQILEPHLSLISTFYWCLFFGLTTYLFTRFIALPLTTKLLKNKQK